MVDEIAIVSPFPPLRSGVATYSYALLFHLKKLGVMTYGINNVRDLELVKDIPKIYMLGNNYDYHGWIYDGLLRYGGVAVIHDTHLIDFWNGRGRNPDSIEKMLLEIQQYSFKIIVHNLFNKNYLLNKGLDDKNICILPFGAKVCVPTPSEHEIEKDFLSKKYNIPVNYPWLLAPGAIQPFKCPELLIKATESLRVNLIFVGETHSGYDIEAVKNKYGIDKNIFSTGWVPRSDWIRFLKAADLGVCLRQPPTHGETSAACLDLLRYGIPTLVFDVGTFSSLPDTIVKKITYDTNQYLVHDALKELLNKPLDRTLIYDWVQKECSWDKVAREYLTLF
jgi:hypothetical protein